MAVVLIVFLVVFSALVFVLGRRRRHQSTIGDPQSSVSLRSARERAQADSKFND